MGMSTWYHGSPYNIDFLITGSTITQDINLAKVFSHKPTIVSTEDDGTIKHNGLLKGYLYIIDEDVKEDDVIEHPRTTMERGKEWLITRQLKLKQVETVELNKEELLSPEDISRLKGAGAP